MLLIYTHQITSRVRYTFNLIFKSILGVDFEITTDIEKFKRHIGTKISYSHAPAGDEIFFNSEELLFEKGIKNTSALPADEFAQAFFLTTRYEEYLPFDHDKHGRYSAKHSLSYKNNILLKPSVNIFALEIKRKITERYPAFVFPENKYSYQPTLDIDNAYAYIGKNFGRTMGGYARAILTSDWDDFKKRRNVFSGSGFIGKEKDPYDTYDLQFELHKKYNLKPIYFFLLGDWAENDKNLPHTHPLMQALIKNIYGKAEIGIHPSYASNKNSKKVKVEKKRLTEITGKEIKKSRQHFLMLKFPQTYRNLISAGITDDYTMGYADELGFRAGICTPLKWYDLEKEEETILTIHPFAVMDGTLNNYLKLSPEQAIEKAKEIVHEIKKVNGEFISIWHNETLSDWREWKGWKNVYEKIIKIAVQG
jgi:hypothetical protein